jgi:hypothetical protein
MHICSCPGEQHPTWGACIRAKGIAIGYCRSATNPRYDRTAQRQWDRDLDAYARARKQGIQPDGTQRRQVERAVRASNETGAAYGNTG